MEALFVMMTKFDQTLPTEMFLFYFTNMTLAF